MHEDIPDGTVSRVTLEGEESSPVAAMLKPTAAYLAIAHSPSLHAAYPYSPCKLLILDLNGSLLLRSKQRNAKQRTVYPRPYMPSFRSYIFHEAVKPWLQVMVWSSAQPHSVNDMVKRCFEDRRHELKAVWARDTLGLNKADYTRKVQTVKDLRKPWSADSPSLPRHNAETTLLLDDSPGKAYLQPYNHLCVPEYTQNVRNRDLTIRGDLSLMEQPNVASQVQLTLHNLASGSIRPATQRRIHTRFSSRPGFDSTLIAVIGVLDEVRGQTNVAGWVRAGGLWAGRVPRSSGHEPPHQVLSGNKPDIYSSNTYSAVNQRSRMDPTRAEEHGVPSNPGNDAELEEKDVMWFNYGSCFQYWVDRGIRTLEVLGIQLDHGVIR